MAVHVTLTDRRGKTMGIIGYGDIGRACADFREEPQNGLQMRGVEAEKRLGVRRRAAGEGHGIMHAAARTTRPRIRTVR